MATEVDEAAIRIMETAWPAVSMLGDLGKLDVKRRWLALRVKISAEPMCKELG